MIKPYNTTYGSLLNIAKVTTALTKYINTVDLNELEYEYPTTGNVKNVFVTGYNDEEQELPSWEHPIIITTLRNEVVVVSDLRRYVKTSKDIAGRVSDIVRDSSSADFVILRTLLTRDFLNDEVTEHREIFKSSTTALGVWVSGMVGTAVLLDPVESFNIEIVASVFANTLYYNEDEVKNNMNTIIARVVGSKHVYKFSKKEIKGIADNYVIGTAGKLQELIDNLKLVVGEDKAQFITIDSLIGVMGNVWYGPGSSETPIIALEHMPTWLALLNSVVTNRSYSKSRIGMLLNKHSRVIDAKQIGKHFENYLKETRV